MKETKEKKKKKEGKKREWKMEVEGGSGGTGGSDEPKKGRKATLLMPVKSAGSSFTDGLSRKIDGIP